MVTRTDSLSPLLGLAAMLAVAPASLAQGAESKPAPDTAAAQSQESARAAVPSFVWVDGYGKRADGKDLGSTHGCLVVDSKGRLLANTDTDDAVLVLGKDGVVASGWGKEYRGGLHGMTLRVEDGKEVLYLAHTMRNEVVKATIDGEVIWTLGWPEESGIYAKAQEFHPTSCVTSTDGRIFVADGYGKSFVHCYDKERVRTKSIGGNGQEQGKMRTPHGLAIDARSGAEQLLVCDRENGRLQWFTLDGEFVRESREGMIRPCNAWMLEDGMVAIADLVGRVTILDQKDKPILVLGEGSPQDKLATNQVGKELWQKDRFFAPHSVCADADGNLYVMDWNVHGRISKLVRQRNSKG